ncbi:SgrR family transcriptional regulator [Xenorhabdus sp. PB62.4]|uniref:SgrR family transcriptional regulator n=1 Tax=Xenorhabdus sp. PB62.4 TaxID=1851573 RepID=UPI001657342E|nr:SgrR family transcriptional regulator [Xenorhabdus sp. PB62.4]MBC8952863.1 hypothetical protein [Xenorhabdus sp. PB62.4]
MPPPLLQQQFIRLWQHYQGKKTETTLQSLADILHCSRRHIRSLCSLLSASKHLYGEKTVYLSKNGVKT